MVRGTIPPRVIFFCLQNQTTENVTRPIAPQVDNPTVPRDQVPEHQGQVQAVISPPFSMDEPDVSAYPEAVVQRMEADQVSSNQTGVTHATVMAPVEAQESHSTPSAMQASLVRRSSSSILSSEEECPNSNLSALESAPIVVITSRCQLPELLATTDAGQDNVATISLQTDDDNISSVCDAPPLPGCEPKIRFLTDQSEGQKSANEATQVNHLVLHGHNPIGFESGPDGGDESSFDTRVLDTSKESSPPAIAQILKTRSCSMFPSDNLLSLLLNRKYITFSGASQMKQSGCRNLPWSE